MLPQVSASGAVTVRQYGLDGALLPAGDASLSAAAAAAAAATAATAAGAATYGHHGPRHASASSRAGANSGAGAGAGSGAHGSGGGSGAGASPALKATYALSAVISYVMDVDDVSEDEEENDDPVSGGGGGGTRGQGWSGRYRPGEPGALGHLVAHVKVS